MTSKESSRIYNLLILPAVVFGLGCLLLFIQYILAPFLVQLRPSLVNALYDAGIFGAFRRETHLSFHLSSPWMNTLRWDPSCDAGYVFLDLGGPATSHQGPVILHSTGQLIYTTDRFGASFNSAVQSFRGKNYLTFWAGRKAKTSGQGQYYMLDEEYRIAYTIRAVGDGLLGDLHEFKITTQGTALISVYNTTRMDLTGMGMFRGPDGWITDGLFQEIDIATNRLLFQWRASDHFKPTDSYMWNPLAGYSSSIPFDFFHINSVDKDSHGNYLISSRHLHLSAYIDGKTGEPIWVLGGALNEFRDLSKGQATTFSWQHHARWVDQENGLISLFDNGRAWPHISAPFSQGRLVHIDANNRTAKLIAVFPSMHHAQSSSQGSMNLISGPENSTHVFLGWGSSAVITEHTLDGTLLCEKHFGASAYFFWERVKSYRAFKTLASHWLATPADWDPSARLVQNRVHVSWNGATTPVEWELQGSLPNGEYQAIAKIEKGKNFETQFDVAHNAHLSYRVAALGADHQVLRYSNVVNRSDVNSSHGTSGYILAMLAVVLIVTAALLWRFRQSMQELSQAIYARLRGFKYHRVP